jgi:DNA primase
MEINGIPLLVDVETILHDLRFELREKDIDLLHDIKPTRNNLMVTCISHGDGHERKPSCGISTKVTKRPDGKIDPEGTVHCFRCDYTANLSEFISNCFGYNDLGVYGTKWLMQSYVSVEVDKRKPLNLNLSRTKDTLKREYISEEELSNYRYTHPYMYQRKLTNAVINFFDVGYDPSTQCLTFPVCDKEGNVLFIQRRSVIGKFFQNDETEKGVTIYGIDKIYKNLDKVKEVIICESIIDALTCWTYKRPAIALMGLGTDNQFRLLKEMPIRKFILALDNDEAGQNAIQRLKRILNKHQLLFTYELPSGKKDINELEQDEFLSLTPKLF